MVGRDIIWDERDLLAIIIAIPILIWLITQSFTLILFTFCITLVIFGLFYTEGTKIFGNVYTDRLASGVDTLLGKNVLDTSVNIKMELWASCLSAIRDNLLWGYDNSNRFTALSVHLPEGFNNKFTHPHNDILASTVSAGLFGGILSIISLLSPMFAVFCQKIISTKRRS